MAMTSIPNQMDPEDPAVHILKAKWNETTCLSLTTDTIKHANQALLLDPTHPTVRIFKALALDLQGHKAIALSSLLMQGHRLQAN